MNKTDIIREIQALKLRPESFWVIGPAALCLADKEIDIKHVSICMACEEFATFLKERGINEKAVKVDITDSITIGIRRVKSKNLISIDGILIKSLDDTAISFIKEIIESELRTIPEYFTKEVERIIDVIANKKLSKFSKEIQTRIVAICATNSIRRLVADRITQLSIK